MQMSPFLRAVLKLDAISCLGIAAATLPFSGKLAHLLGLPTLLLFAAAASLVPVGLFILWLGLRTSAPAAMISFVIAGNIAWAASSLYTAFHYLGITSMGQLAVAGQAFGVLGFALIEWAGLRNSAGLNANA